MIQRKEERQVSIKKKGKNPMRTSDSITKSNIRLTGIPEEEVWEKGTENLFKNS